MTGTQCNVSQGQTYFFSEENGDPNLATWTTLGGASTLRVFDSFPTLGDFSPLFNTSYSTRFVSLDITGTSSVSVNVGYFINEDEVDLLDPFRNPTLIRHNLSKRPSTTVSTLGFDMSTTTGTSSLQSNLGSFSDGVYDLLVTFGNQATPINGIIPFPDAYVYSSFEISSGLLISTTTDRKSVV